MLLDAHTVFLNEKRPGVDQIVVILTDGDLHTEPKTKIDQLFDDPYWSMNWVALEYQTIAVGVGPKVFENWDNLFLLGRDFITQKKSIRKLQSNSDIRPAVDFVNQAIERTCYNPMWSQIDGQVKNMTLFKGDYQFLAYEVSTFDQGMHLNLTLPKDEVDVYASLFTTRPTLYQHTFTARLLDERDSVRFK